MEESSTVPHTDKPGRGPLNTPDDETPTSDPIIKYLRDLSGEMKTMISKMAKIEKQSSKKKIGYKKTSRFLRQESLKNDRQ